MKLHLTDEQVAEIWEDAPEWATCFTVDENGATAYWCKKPNKFTEIKLSTSNGGAWELESVAIEPKNTIKALKIENWRELCFERPIGD